MSNVWTLDSDAAVASVPIAGVSRVESGGFRSLYTAPAGAQTQAMRMAAQADAEPDADPMEQARIEAFAMGFDEGCRVTEEGMAADAEARNRLAEALEMLTPAPSGTLATMLSATVIRLVTQIVGEVEIDSGLLQQRCEGIAAFVEDNEGKSALHLHPDDIPLVEGSRIGVKLVGDASMSRGCVRLDTADGWVEDGPDVRLARLRALLDDMEGRS
ncbi:flagellar biosynthetic protein FliH [Sphingobium cloacae]|uniref:Flagellar biosynthetic protein FliH n=1 Tax=Sphingobium cloacae TaxID=120107 RepID=A0A1E1F2B8_9SPHN|nr:flagellar biosynthetic protein FliH [Sphingobium cloacae]